ncbi:Uncharacterized protein dnl_32060 [Desulfonema limicola]|uniref:Uncharacterized protein n=1 Tax=Desulfonema limicola TaxID=45656 RepID=A0A975GGZ6_9BACT|nr:Uncharacterized protein dnl_32060 [Desulfonema limicola]
MVAGIAVRSARVRGRCRFYNKLSFLLFIQFYLYYLHKDSQYSIYKCKINFDKHPIILIKYMIKKGGVLS